MTFAVGAVATQAREALRSLDEIDTVEWSQPQWPPRAAAVPGLLEGLVRGRADLDESACAGLLMDAAAPAGVVDEVTVAALPFVLELMVAHNSLRPLLVEWLTELEWVFDEVIDLSNDHPVESNLDEASVKACRATLLAATPALVRLLDDPRPAVRASVAEFFRVAISV